MTELVQNLVIIVFIAIAIIYLVYHLIKKRRDKDACSNCPIQKITKR